MLQFLRGVLVLAFVAASALPAVAKTSARHRRGPVEKKPTAPARTPESIEAATRLQIFLDRANFAPGRLDGTYGEFTLKALALFRQSRGEPVMPAPTHPAAVPDVAGLDLTSFGPAFVPYTVSEADAQLVGPVPSDVREQAKLKALPYRDLPEALGEKFHSDPRFLNELNAGKLKAVKAGDQIMVPNVEPFEIRAVKEIKPGSEVAPQPAANDLPDDAETAGGAEKEPSPSAPITVKVDTKTNLLGVFEGDKLIASYPVTIGSARTRSPIGEWKIRGVAKLPNFRYDEQMLNHGQRSANFQMLAPGPNNPVGVMWIALNKKGIGLHGTADPDSIGRSASHGCVRLANWDIVRLAGKVKGGVPVSIH